jgi:hypothetical protein
MESEPITFPRVGARVWALCGLHDHGPAEGPKSSVGADTGGTVIRTEQPYRTMDLLLYVVRWDTGEETKHYFKELLVIGPFGSMDEFRSAVVQGEQPRLVLGPQGGFRAFKMVVRKGGLPLRVELVQEQGHLWRSVFQPMLESSGQRVEIERLQPKMRGKR